MRIFLSIVLFVLLLDSNANVYCQQILNRDADLFNMVNQVSSDNIRKTINSLVNFGTRHSFSKAETGKGINAACKWVYDEFNKIASESEGQFEAVWDTFTVKPDGRRIKNEAKLVNVLGILKGSDKTDSRIFIVSGHIDSRAGNANDVETAAPGANDDASGVALVMELARIMSQKKFPAQIIFAVFTGEEQGLLGATHLAKKAKDENWNIAAVLNNDMVGNNQASGTGNTENTFVRVFSEGIPAFETEQMKSSRMLTSSENDSPARQLARYIKETGERYVDNLIVKLIYRNDRFMRGGDHTPFCRNGFTAVRFTEMNENFDRQHQNIRDENGIKYGDLPEFVDYEYVRKIACINLAVLASLNLAPPPPSKVAILVKEVSNSTELTWEPSEGKKPEGYYVLLRETSSPLWEKKIYTKENHIKLPYSKDNYFFAVQSVDDSGHESIPVFTSVQR